MSHGGGGDERWLVSYADFITLLMVLFIVLYSMGQTDLEKYKELSESLREAFEGGPARMVDPSINLGGVGTGDSAADAIVVPDLPRRPPDTVDVADRISALLMATGLENEVSVKNNIEGTLISLSERLLFTPGTPELQPAALPFLSEVAAMIKPLPNEIRVIGHTDDSPPLDPRYTSNWDLSVARAVTIVEYLIAVGVPAEHLTAAGQGEFQPVFQNDSDEHRALNGRAEIIIIYPIEKRIFNLGYIRIDNP